VTMRRPRDPLTVLVLAAGQGKRMRSRKIKLLHEVAGRPMVVHVLEAARVLRPDRLITVIGYQADDVRAATEHLSDEFVVQKEQRGTGHAVLQAAKLLDRRGRSDLLILNGDLPTLKGTTLRGLIDAHRRFQAAMTLVTAELEEPTGYGRIVRDDRGGLRRIVEESDADRATRRIREVNCGIYCSDATKLTKILQRVRPDNVQDEYYLTDAVHQLIAAGSDVAAFLHRDVEEVLGVNTRADLARASKTLYARKAAKLQDTGVTLLDPERAWIDPRARVGRDTVVYPDVIVEGACTIGENCIIRPGTRIVDSVIGRGAEIKDHSVIAESRIGELTTVGPFAHLRPGTVLDAQVRVGNFVETKKARLRTGTKASHLSYLGDTDIGEGSNIGAGTITCNYDGEKKHFTKLGKGVFVGSDTQFIAPVKVGDGAYVGAGTTVTKDVPPGALAVARADQRNVEGWVERRDARRKVTGGDRSGKKKEVAKGRRRG
jgi:bifunctional UDP-N-acetylglucosamine pyrophosphorylase/glucosamine-1-phosphate N-acetyltransferase